MADANNGVDEHRASDGVFGALGADPLYRQLQSFSFNWATCELVKTYGNETVHPAVQPVLKLHDDMTKVESGLKLA